MKHLALIFFLFLLSQLAYAQNKEGKVDTVEKGFYILPDTNWNRFVVTIFINGVAVDRDVKGNELPPDIILMIISLDTGDRVLYHRITRRQFTTHDRLPSRQYIIGEKNSVTDVVYVGGDTIRITASGLADIELDTGVLAFSVSLILNKKAIQFGCSGNSIPLERKEIIRSLDVGQHVFFQMILVQRPDGSTYRIPQRTYLIVE